MLFCLNQSLFPQNDRGDLKLLALNLHRNGEEWRADRLLLNKEVMMSAAVWRFLPLLDEVAKDFSRMLRTKVEREGRGEEGKRSLTMDPSPDLFRFALEGLRSSSGICDLVSTVEVHVKSLFTHTEVTEGCKRKDAQWGRASFNMSLFYSETFDLDVFWEGTD